MITKEAKSRLSLDRKLKYLCPYVYADYRNLVGCARFAHA